MTKLLSTLLIVFTYSQFSCNNVGIRRVSTENKDVTASSTLDDTVSNNAALPDLKTLTKDFITWYTYTYYNVRLSQDFIGLDVDSTKIDKATFLDNLMTGDVIALKVKILQGKPVYKLFKNNSNDESIKATVKQMASLEMTHFKMEGTEISKFNFVDLNEKIYDKSSTQGKIIVLKCWFIHCVPCVKEFPESNKLVDEYRSRSDIQFISLAMDKKKDLMKFLESKEFKYAVVPEMANYMTDELHISEYPTHLLIGKNGKIVKVVNRIDDLIPFLKKESEKTKP